MFPATFSLTNSPRFGVGDHTELVQARKALRNHIFGRIEAGETDEQRLVVSGLTHLKSLERQAEEPKR